MPQKKSIHRIFEDRALRLVADRMENDPELTTFAACKDITPKLGVAVESLRRWSRQAEIDSGTKPGVRAETAAENKALKRENAELRRTHEILKTASAFFAAEPGRPATR